MFFLTLNDCFKHTQTQTHIDTDTDTQTRTQTDTQTHRHRHNRHTQSEFPKKTLDDELQKMPHTKIQKCKHQARLVPAL